MTAATERTIKEDTLMTETPPAAPRTAGEAIDRLGDMLSPREWVDIIDRNAWGETVVGIYQLLERRYRDDPRAAEMLRHDLSDIDPGLHDVEIVDGEARIHPRAWELPLATPSATGDTEEPA
jgi:hypothetical protein